MLKPTRGRGRPIALVLAAMLALTGTAAAAPEPAPTEPVSLRQQWVLRTLNAERAWTVTKGAGATVAVIDSGVDDQVAELRGRVIQGPDLRPPMRDGKVRVGNHGTAMASLIVGSGGEDRIQGIAPEARVLALPVLNDQPLEGEDAEPELRRDTGDDNLLARAIRYAADRQVDVISMSLGGYGPQSAEREAVSYALSRGVVLVAAVGNDGNLESSKESGTTFWNFPAGYSGVIGVAAVSREGASASFSSDNLSVLVAAPGAGVPVVLPGGGHPAAEGTSPATALVAGVAALIKAKYPDLSPALVARALTSTAKEVPAAGYDDEVGFGVVDAAAALDAAGRLAGRDRTLAVPEGRHFGAGPAGEAPRPPGPDLLRLWLYAGSTVIGLLIFGAAVMVLTRRAEQKTGVRPPS
ncbi:type VII secretion-associated serine protease [Microtetraspora sp. NBRC 13810]|uniref:S8 family serine peptidase n=1 Tax=Microtetraspora sp. NBRC 13810 TaxID=3030990 RepID=UPI0024A1D593|nr:S8 family serine peptidase [Microtetraspora sp. NBRC 13810]GLW07554.1 type VII secretion-associated serine protease [Microtetraspora sp. NBRC 13810]